MKKASMILLFLFTAGFIGCGMAADTETAGEGNTDAVITEAAEGMSDEGSMHVEFLQGKPESVDAYEKVIQLFEQQNSGIDVEQVNLPDTYTVLTTRLSSEEYPDLFNHFPLRPTLRYWPKVDRCLN